MLTVKEINRAATRQSLFGLFVWCFRIAFIFACLEWFGIFRWLFTFGPGF